MGGGKKDGRSTCSFYRGPEGEKKGGKPVSISFFGSLSREKKREGGTTFRMSSFQRAASGGNTAALSPERLGGGGESFDAVLCGAGGATPVQKKEKEGREVIA